MEPTPSTMSPRAVSRSQFSLQTRESTPGTSQDEQPQFSSHDESPKTQLLELLHYVHTLLFLNVEIPSGTQMEQEADRDDEGDAETERDTDPLRPDRLQAWTSFPSEQTDVWHSILGSSISSESLFPPVSVLQKRAQDVHSQRCVGYQSFIWNITQRIDLYVQAIIYAMASNDVLRQKFSLKGTLYASRDSTALLPRNSDLRFSSCKTPEEIKRATRGRPRYTQICAYNSPGNLSAANPAVPAFIAAYKSRRLSLQDIYTGLVDMDLGSVTPKLNDENYKARCRRKVAAAVTHVVSYMVRSGLEFGYITTGEAWIFLRVPDDPKTVFYYLSVPEVDVGVSTDYAACPYEPSQRLHLTAAGQLAAFTLRAFQKNPRAYSWRERAVAEMNTWKTISTTLQPLGASQGGTVNETSGIGRFVQMWPVRASGRTYTTAAHVASGDALRQKYNGPPYCTEACLRSMRKKGRLQDCPNKHLHGTIKHKIDNRKFLQLLQQQLKMSYDRDFEPTGLHGSRAALVKVTLSSHGYTVAAKCTPREFYPRLRHERKVYKRLERIQGQYAPRYLGLVRLLRPYHYAGIIDVEHMMVLGNAGETFGQHESTMDHDTMVDCTKKAFGSIHELGVLHNDPHPFNLRYNTETGTVMVFDFDRSTMDDPRGRKRKRSDDDKESSDCSPSCAWDTSCDGGGSSPTARQDDYQEETELVCDEVDELIEKAHVAKRRRLAPGVWWWGSSM